MSNNTTPDNIIVEPGQIWHDVLSGGTVWRRLRVDSVEDDRVRFTEIATGQKTRIRLAGLRKSSRGRGFVLHSTPNGLPPARAFVSTTAISPEGVEIMIGQQWRDMDKRGSGRIFTITGIVGDKVKVNDGGRNAQIKIARLKKGSTGYELVK